MVRVSQSQVSGRNGAKLPQGRALGVVSRQHAPEGYMDLDLDDYKSGSLYSDWQKIVMDTAGILVSDCAF